MEEGNLSSHKQLFNTAISVLHWCLREVRKGRVIASLDEKTMKYKELVIPPFRTAA
jgi:hypothetical protein